MVYISKPHAHHDKNAPGSRQQSGKAVGTPACLVFVCSVNPTWGFAKHLFERKLTSLRGIQDLALSYPRRGVASRTYMFMVLSATGLRKGATYLPYEPYSA